MQRTVRATVPNVAQATPDLHGIPWNCVATPRALRQKALGQTQASAITVVEASGALTGESLEWRKTMAFASIAVAFTAVGAFHPRMCIIVSNQHFSRPSKPSWACP